ncbi:MAG: 2-amino-4-hydroxy-6-hydroxymethyldihydropteridine diphosphokinase [Pararhodobacter sp.]
MDNNLPSVHRNLHLLALGSNASGDESSNSLLLNQAIAAIKQERITTLRLSRFFCTPAFPAGAGPDFVNACLVARSELGPEGVLAAAHRVEQAMGRVRDRRWGQRVIDIDLLASGDAVLPDRGTVAQWMALPPADQQRLTPEGLILPHPRLHQRGFVLTPLCDVAPDWVHPLTGKSVRAMLDALDSAELAGIRPIIRPM